MNKVFDLVTFFWSITDLELTRMVYLLGFTWHSLYKVFTVICKMFKNVHQILIQEIESLGTPSLALLTAHP